MPYNDPERKRQWEQEHREERNARRKTQRLDIGSGQPSVPKATSDIAAALHTHVRERAPDPGSDQKACGTWKAVIGWVIGIGVVLLGVSAGVSGFNADHSVRRGSGNPLAMDK